MRWVAVAARRPQRCSFIPFVGSHHPEGYFDFGTESTVMDEHHYVSVVAVKQMATALGWVPAGDMRGLNIQIGRLEAELAQEKARNAELRRKQEAIDVMESEGFRARKKPGRKPQEVA